MITDRKRLADRVVIAAVITMFLSGCRSSPVSPSSGTDMNVSYNIPNRSHVTLTVSNSYHTIMSTLVDTTENAGSYRITWSTAAYPSGVYFYRFIAIPESGGAVMDISKKFIVSG